MENARNILNMPSAFGVTVRFAMKANLAIQMFETCGNSSYWCVECVWGSTCSTWWIWDRSHLAFDSDVEPRIQNLFPKRNYGTCARSLNSFVLWKASRLSGTWTRFNPGLGSGEVDATNVGGPASSFEFGTKALTRLKRFWNVFRFESCIHTHIGSGTDVKIWNKAANLSLRLCSLHMSRHWILVEVLKSHEWVTRSRQIYKRSENTSNDRSNGFKRKLEESYIWKSSPVITCAHLLVHWCVRFRTWRRHLDTISEVGFRYDRDSSSHALRQSAQHCTRAS